MFPLLSLAFAQMSPDDVPVQSARDEGGTGTVQRPEHTALTAPPWVYSPTGSAWTSRLCAATPRPLQGLCVAVVVPRARAGATP